MSAQIWTLDAIQRIGRQLIIYGQSTWILYIYIESDFNWLKWTIENTIHELMIQRLDHESTHQIVWSCQLDLTIYFLKFWYSLPTVSTLFGHIITHTIYN